MTNSDMVNEILVGMQDDLNEAQMTKLNRVLYSILRGKKIIVETTEVSCSTCDANEFLLRKFELDLKVRNLASGTIYHYIAESFKFLQSINKSYIDVTKDDVMYYVSELYQTKSHTTVYNTCRYIRSFFTWLKENEYIIHSPFDKIRISKNEEIHKTILNDCEIEQMRDHCESLRDTAIIDTLLSTGLRVSEIVSINTDDVDFEHRCIEVYAQKTKTYRTVYLDSKAVIHLQNYLKSKKHHTTALFSNKYANTRMSKTAVQNVLHRVANNAGIDKRVTVHTLRKTFASKLFRLGMEAANIAKLLGHKSVETTIKYYVGINKDALKNEYLKLAS